MSLRNGAGSMLKKIRNVALILMVAPLVYGAQVSAEVAVIVNANDSNSVVSVKDVKSLFLGKSTSTSSGAEYEVRDLPQNSAVKEEFYQKAIKKDLRQLKAYWAKRIFTGKGKPPVIASNEDAAKKWVSEATGRMGYISTDAVDSSVKVLLTLP